MQYNDNELIYMIKEDEEALNFLIEKYEPLFRSLSYSFAKKYSYRGIEVEDLVQQCRITLCKVVDRYDYNREVLFYSYLLVCLKGAILKYCRKYNVKTDNFNYMDIDNYYDIPINKFNRTHWFPSGDGTHHNVLGGKLIAQHMVNNLY